MRIGTVGTCPKQFRNTPCWQLDWVAQTRDGLIHVHQRKWSTWFSLSTSGNGIFTISEKMVISIQQSVFLFWDRTANTSIPHHVTCHERLQEWQISAKCVDYVPISFLSALLLIVCQKMRHKPWSNLSLSQILLQNLVLSVLPLAKCSYMKIKN